jgi:hypothetical protein
MQLGHTNMWCSYLIIILFYIEYYFLLSSISPFSSNLLLTFIFFIHIIIVLNAQTKIQYDAMVYLCLSKVLLIFKHD